MLAKAGTQGIAEESAPGTPACERVRIYSGRTNSSSPRTRGPRSKRLKFLGSRFRGNDG
jgi:hypothetical protein